MKKIINKTPKPIKIYLVLLPFICSMLFMSCEEFLEIDTPRAEIVTEDVFKTDETVLAAVRGFYTELDGFDAMWTSGLEQLTGICSDEFTNFNSNLQYIQFAENEILIENTLVNSAFWTNGYRVISSTNAVIEGVRNNTLISPDVRDMAIGEALFFRAFAHLYLVNLFGDIPYANSTDVDALTTAVREPEAEVYQKIIADLIEAAPLMSPDFSHTRFDRVRANRAAAFAVLARAYLYIEDWENAEIQATKVIDDPLFELEPDPTNVFEATSSEAIWQKWVQDEGINIPRYAETIGMIIEGPLGDLPPGGFFGSLGAFAMTDGLVAAFEAGDERFNDWVGIKTIDSDSWHYSFKFKRNRFNSSTFASLPFEHFTVLRLAEQYLIRAEARAQQGDIIGAQEDLNVIRNRANLGNTTAMDQASLLTAVAQERRIELFAEGGHRWFDIKRRGEVDVVMAPLKSGWQSTDALWPIPEQETLNNSNLTQNPGY